MIETRCEKVMDSEESWREFLGACTEHEAWEAISDVFDLARSLERKSIPATRLFDLYEKGCDLYQQRFGSAWAPF